MPPSTRAMVSPPSMTAAVNSLAPGATPALTVVEWPAGDSAGGMGAAVGRRGVGRSEFACEVEAGMGMEKEHTTRAFLPLFALKAFHDSGEASTNCVTLTPCSGVSMPSASSWFSVAVLMGCSSPMAGNLTRFSFPKVQQSMPYFSVSFPAKPSFLNQKM